MKKQIEQRLDELKREFASGQQMMTELESKQAGLRDSLLRINGAMQVLDELLAQEAEVAEEAVEHLQVVGGD